MDKYLISNSKIGLRKTQAFDIDYVLKVEKDDENKHYIGQWKVEKHIESLSDRDILHIIIEEISREIPLGYIIIAGLSNPNKSLEFRRIAVEEKGKGIGKETLELIKVFAFEKNDFNRLWLDVRIKNERAQYVYKKQGFIEEGTLREAVIVDDKYESLIIMSMLRRDYLQLQTNTEFDKV